MKIILVRHCTTSWNREKRLQGQTDVPLDTGGLAETKVLGIRMAVLGIERIISSQLQRALQTAGAISGACNLPVEIDTRICEASFGSLEGNTKEEALRKYGDSILPHWNDEWQQYDFRPWGGESQAQVKERHMQVVSDIQARPEKTVLMVGHGRGFATLLGALSQEPTLRRNEWRVVII